MIGSIMFWNVQGAASPNFRQAFRSLINSYKPLMVVMLEPRIVAQKLMSLSERVGLTSLIESKPCFLEVYGCSEFHK